MDTYGFPMACVWTRGQTRFDVNRGSVYVCMLCNPWDSNIGYLGYGIVHMKIVLWADALQCIVPPFAQCRHCVRLSLRDKSQHCEQESCAIAKMTARCALSWAVLEIYDRLRRYGHLKFFQDGGGRHLGFVRTWNSAIRSAVPENPTLEPNMEWIGRSVAEIWPFEIFEMRGRSSVGRSSIYTYLHWSHLLLFATLGT